MRNYLEHFFRLPSKFVEHHEEGRDEWVLLLKSSIIVQAAESDGFRLKEPQRKVLQREGDVDIVEMCVRASMELLSLSRRIPFGSYLSATVLPACEELEAFLAGVAPDNGHLLVSGPVEHEPKRHFPIDFYILDKVKKMCLQYPSQD